MRNVKKKLRKVIKPVRKFIKRANAARVSFKKKYPKTYKFATGYAADVAMDSTGYGAEYQAAKGIYRAYKGRNRGGLYNRANDAYTLGRVGYSMYKRGAHVGLF